MLRLISIIFLFFFSTNPSYSYLGPGVGGGIIAATLGVIIAILAAIFGLIWFPLRKYLIKKKNNKKHKKIDKSNIINSICNHYF